MATNNAINAETTFVLLNATPSSSPTINASVNVSSLTRQSTGNYTINFTNSFADSHYCIGSMGQSGASNGGYIAYKPSGTVATSSVQIQNLDNSGSLVDTGNVLTVAIYPL